MAAKARATNFLMIGNPGTGKSTILNGMIGEPRFKSGVNYGEGMTFQFDAQTVPPHTYMDTPGLADTKLRRQAAAAITQALKRDGYYKIFFVVTLQNGRVRAEDVTTMKLVLESAPITDYGIIINQLPAREFRDLDKQDSPELASVMASMMTGMLPERASYRVCLVKRDDDLEGQDNAVKQLPEDLLAFIDGLPGVEISPRQVTDVNPRGFEEMQAKMEADLEAVRKDRDAAMKRFEEQGFALAKLQEQLKERRPLWKKIVGGVVGGIGGFLLGGPAGGAAGAAAGSQSLF